MKKNRVGRKFDREQIFHPTFSGSSNNYVGSVYSLFHQTFHSYQIEMSLIILNYKNKMGKNTKIQQKKLKTKESIQS